MMMLTIFTSSLAILLVCACAGIPEMPPYLNVLVTGASELRVTFTTGNNGGAPQTFTIDYSVKDIYPQVIRGIEDPKNTRTVTYTLRHLLAGTTYYIKVKAVNVVGHSSFTDTVSAQTSENAITMEAEDLAGVTISVILFAFAISLAIAVIVKMRRMNVACFAVQGSNQDPVTNLGETNLGEMEAATNKAFEGDTDQEYYVNPTPEARDVVEPDYVNQPRRIRDSDDEAYEDVLHPYNPYAGLDKDVTREAAEDHTYEALETAHI